MNEHENGKNEESIASMIAKVELSAEIAQIALSCSHCVGPVQDAINRFKNRNQGKNVNANVNPVRGHSSFAATNESMDGLAVNETIRQQYK